MKLIIPTGTVVAVFRPDGREEDRQHWIGGRLKWRRLGEPIQLTAEEAELILPECDDGRDDVHRLLVEGEEVYFHSRDLVKVETRKKGKKK